MTPADLTRRPPGKLQNINIGEISLVRKTHRPVNDGATITFVKAEDHAADDAGLLRAFVKALRETFGKADHTGLYQATGETAKVETQAHHDNADGSYDPFTGTHSHPHPSFDGDTDGGDNFHTHPHTHTNDSDHHHPTEQPGAPDVPDPAITSTHPGVPVHKAGSPAGDGQTPNSQEEQQTMANETVDVTKAGMGGPNTSTERGPDACGVSPTRPAADQDLPAEGVATAATRVPKDGKAKSKASRGPITIIFKAEEDDEDEEDDETEDVAKAVVTGLIGSPAFKKALRSAIADAVEAEVAPITKAALDAARVPTSPTSPTAPIAPAAAEAPRATLNDVKSMSMQDAIRTLTRRA